MFNGDKGRLELEVVETTHRNPIAKGGNTAGVTHGEQALPNEGHQRIILHPLWETPQEVPFTKGEGGHGELSAPSNLHAQQEKYREDQADF
jgi:hypothetical protein